MEPRSLIILKILIVVLDMKFDLGLSCRTGRILRVSVSTARHSHKIGQVVLFLD